MSFSISNRQPVRMNTETAHAVKTAELAKSKTEKEGEMALNLIQPADAATASPVGNRGHNISVAV
jgi:hypothetical protein